MNAKTSSPLFSGKRLGVIGAIICVFLTFSLAFVPSANAYTFFPNTPIAIASNTGHLELTYGTGTCSYQNFLYAFYVEPSSGLVYWSSSSTGLAGSWTTPVALFTLTSPASTTATLLTSNLYKQTCNGPNPVFAWIDNSGGAGKFHIDYEFCAVGSGAVTCNSIVTMQPLSKAGGTPINMATGSTIDDVEYLNGLLWLSFSVVSVNRGVSINGISSFNTTTINSPIIVGWVSGSTYILVGGSGGATAFSTEYTTNAGTNWHGGSAINSLNGGSVGQGANGNPNIGNFANVGGVLYFYFIENHSGANCSTSQCLEAINFNAQGATYGQVTVADVVGAGYVQATTDGISTIVIFGGSTAGAVGTFTTTTNANTASPTYVVNTYVGPVSNGGAANFPGSLGMTFSPQIGQFVVETGTSSGTFNVYVQVFGLPPTSGSTQAFTIGSCPLKNTATTTLSNTTIYLWQYQVFASTTLNTISAELASVTSVAANENLYFGIYVTSTAGPISAANPLLLSGFKTWTLTAGTKNQLLAWSTNTNINLPSGSTIAIAIVGNSKININQSSLSGMTTAATTGGNLQVSLTSTSSSNAELFFCATGSYQSQATVTVTSTSTSTVTTGGGTATATVTSTSTVTSISSNAVLGSDIGFLEMFLLIVLPGVALALIGIATHSAPLTGVLFIAGLTLGTALGNLAGLVPFTVDIVMIMIIIFLSLGMVIVITRGGTGSVGV